MSVIVPILGILLIKDADIMVLDLVLKDWAAVLQLHNEVIVKWKQKIKLSLHKGTRIGRLL